MRGMKKKKKVENNFFFPGSAQPKQEFTNRMQRDGWEIFKKETQDKNAGLCDKTH